MANKKPHGRTKQAKVHSRKPASGAMVRNNDGKVIGRQGQVGAVATGETVTTGPGQRQVWAYGCDGPANGGHTAWHRASGDSGPTTMVGVRLTVDEMERVDYLREVHGGDRSTLIRRALHEMDIENERRESLQEFLDEAHERHGGRDYEAEARIRERLTSS